MSDFESVNSKIYELLDTDLNLALELVDSALYFVQGNDNQIERAHLLYIKGYIYDEQNSLPKALVEYLNAAELLKSVGEKSAKMKYIEIILNISAILTRHHRYDKALNLIEDVMLEANELEYESQIQKLLYNKAYNLRRFGDYPNSILTTKSCADKAMSEGDTTMIIKCFNLLGLTHKDNGFLDEAKEYYQYILDLPTATDKDRARALHNTAIVYGEEGNSEQAKIYFESALSLKRKIKDKKLLFTTLFDLSEWHLTYGSLDSANRLAKQAELIYPKLLCEPESFKIYHLLSEISAKRGDYQESKFYADLAYDESLKFNDSTSKIMEQKDKFQIDLILAGFNAEQEAQDQRFKATLNRWLIAILLVGCVIAYLYWRIWFHRWRTDLWNRIYACSIGIQERS